MRSPGVLLLRNAVIACTLAFAAPAFLETPVQSTAAAAKRKKKRKKKRNRSRRKAEVSDPSRVIRKEEKLAPKKEYGLDEQLQKTKDLRPAAEAKDRPTLTPDQLKAKRTENLLDEKIDEEIELAQSLVELSQGCEEVSPVRFRLADLYWEKSKRAFFKANDFSVPEGERAKHNRLMKRLHQKTLDNYGSVVDECPGYSEVSKVLFFLGRALAELERPKEGAAYFKRIIKEFPESEWVPQSWFMVGEYYFNTAGDAHAALKAYKKATVDQNTPIFAYGIYKQGWCHINTGDWDLALKRFQQVVQTVDDPHYQLDNRARVALRKEALKDYVRAYSNIGEARNAYRTFTRVGGGAAVAKMLETLGTWYINQGGHHNTVVVYRDLIKNYPRSTRLPVFQGFIVDAASRMGDRKGTVKQVKLLTDYFLALRKRVQTGDLNDDERGTIDKDLKQGEEIAENTLRRLAMDYHKDAKKLRGTAADQAYRHAHDLYHNYLQVFPEPNPKADVNYVFFMRFYYAEILYKLEKFHDAAKNYEAVVEMNPHPEDKRQKEMVLAAAEEAVRSYDELVQDLDRAKPPVVSGRERKPIPEIKTKLIAACQRYIEYVGSAGEKIVEIRYKMARIYYTYNHFEKAAPAFNDIVENHPSHSVACYAANLALDIYNGEKNYAALKEKSRAYLDSKELACGDEDRVKFAKIEEQSSFHLVKTDMEEKKKYLAAGNAYLQFYRDYPKSAFADDAVYNAAVNFDHGNRLDKANEVRRFLVEKLPDSPLVPETLFNIAQSYERIVDFQNAAHYLELFAKRYPKDKRSKDAIYNAGLYRATLQDFDGAKESRERFIKIYSGDKEVHNVAFSICESAHLDAELTEKNAKAQGKLAQQDRVIGKKWVAAHDCYFGWIKNKSYVKRDTDALCYAQYRRGEIMRLKTKYAKGAAEQRKYLMTQWPSWREKKGVKELPRCADAVARIKFRDLQPAIKKYTAVTISELNPTDKGKKRFDASIKVKIAERDKLVKRFQEVAEIGVAQWSLASLFRIGELYHDSVRKLLQAPIPNKIPGYKLSKDDKQMLRNQLREMAGPIEDAAVEAYRVCVDKANELGVYNTWSMQALQQLQKLRPDEYPPVEERMPPVRFSDKLAVVSNPLVIHDGSRYTPVHVKYGSDKPEEKKSSGAAKQGKGSKGKKSGKSRKSGADKKPRQSSDGVPLPVEVGP